MCYYPRLLNNKKYYSNKKNGGVIPPIVDERTRYVAVGCGNCRECMKQKARNWQVRLLEDIKENRNGKMVTLTFSNEQLKYIVEGRDTNGKLIREPLKTEGYLLDNQIATIAVRGWLERWRKKHKKSLRHWLITELGHQNTENIHLHGIIWTDWDMTEVENHWKYGFIWKGYKKVVKDQRTGIRKEIYENYVNEKTVTYLTKYVTKMDMLHKEYKPIILTSAGIGRNYTISGNWKNNIYKSEDTDETYRNRQGFKMALPTYWRNKIYSEEEREKLWINKLNQNIRYVNGNKIEVGETDEHYWNILEQAREQNKRLGYGTDEKDWNREVYEREVRIIKQKARINNASGGAPAGGCPSPGPAGFGFTSMIQMENIEQIAGAEGAPGRSVTGMKLFIDDELKRKY